MNLKNLIEECADVLNEQARNVGGGNLRATVFTNDGKIDLDYSQCLDGKWTCEAFVSHNDKSKNTPERYSENLECFLAKHLEGCVDWKAIEESDDSE